MIVLSSFLGNGEIFKDLILTVGLPYEFYTYCFFLEILKKQKKSSENDQSTGHFQSFFIFFFVPPTLDLKKIPINQLIKNSGLSIVY